jgi:hypothetical protein
MTTEISYYSEIQKFIEIQLISNFKVANNRNLHLFWGIGELKSNLQKIIADHHSICLCAEEFSKNVPPLNLDIFSLVTDGNKFEILILEVKRTKSVGLREWSQLVGYCLVSIAKYVVLVNINNGRSQRLQQILQSDQSLSVIQTKVNDKYYNNLLGLISCNSHTKNFEYSNLGFIKSISQLSNVIIKDFN